MVNYAQIKQTISLYEALGKDIENDYLEDAKQIITGQKKEIERKDKVEVIFEEKEDSEPDNERNGD